VAAAAASAPTLTEEAKVEALDPVKRQLFLDWKKKEGGPTFFKNLRKEEGALVQGP
jgi:hypothetical protein